MLIRLIFASCVLASFWHLGDGQSAQGTKLDPDPTYFISVPRRVHPGEVIQTSLTVMKLLFPHINVRVSIIRNNREMTFVQHQFTRPTTQLMQMELPITATDGDYSVRIEGSMNGGVTGFLFENTTKIAFQPKRMSVFIQMSRPFYKQGEKVRFRVIPLTQDLMAAPGSLDIHVKDSSGYTVRRWLAQQTNAGVLNMKFDLSDQPRYGRWTVEVVAQGYRYQDHFYVEEYFMPIFEVNVTTPSKMFDNDFGLQGVIVANHSSGIPARGNGTITLEVRPMDRKKWSENPVFPTLTRHIRYFSGVADFLFTMQELKQLSREIQNTEIMVNVTLYDWLTRWNVTGFSSTLVYGSGVKVKWLGQQPQTFKPGMHYVTYVAVTNEDGSPIPASVRKEVTFQANVEYLDSSTDSSPHMTRAIPDNGVVKFEYTPHQNARRLTLSAWYGRHLDTRKTLLSYRYFSITNSYIQATTETENPRVNEYMVFTVRTNHYVDRLYYLVMAAGNIIMADELSMTFRQKTWSIAVSRKMAPSAHMLVYYIKKDGEVISDSLNFHVNISRLMNVEVEVNRGKDFTRRTAQLSAIAEPASYVAFTGMYYDLYARGARPFLTEEKIMREMYTYDSHTNTSYTHSWLLPEEEIRLLSFPSTDQGQDCFQTFNFAGLVVFTDANITKLETDCNATLGQLPCRGGKCYHVNEKCDGSDQCPDGTDEINCEKEEEIEVPAAIRRLKHTMRHYDDNSWAWQDHIIKANKRVDITVDVPEYPLEWVISAFAIHPYDGLSMLKTPYRFSAVRPFYISLEYPEEIKQGETIGLRVGVFNFWDQYIDCLITLHDSSDYYFVHVEEGGLVSSYNPRKSTGDRHVLVNLLPGRTTYIFMPIVTRSSKYGKVCARISAETFIGGDEEVACFNVVPYGVENYYGTPYFVDLSSQGSLIVPSLRIPVPEQFILPEQPYFRYVPDSPRAVVSVSGDVVGSYFNTTPLTTQETVRKPGGGGEAALYNLGVNVYTLIYLQSTNQLKDQQSDMALEYMNVALQRVLSFFNDTGSFMPFRENSNGSVWLTAIAGKVLHAARSSDWENYMFVPIELLNNVTLWLCDQQNATTGAFLADDVLYDRRYVSNKSSDIGSTPAPSFSSTVFPGLTPTRQGWKSPYRNLSITAHVMIALMEMTQVNGEANQRRTDAITRAEKYLVENIDHITDPFQACLVACALHIKNSNGRNDIFKVMDSLKRTREDMFYWADRPIEANPLDYVSSEPYLSPRVYHENEGYAVMATTYAFFTYMNRNELSAMTTIVKFLSTLRNYANGFVSTADTMLAIEALGKYAKADQNHDTYNLQFSVTSNEWNVRESLDRNDIGSIVPIPLPIPHGYADIVAQGTGFGMVHLATTVNVERSHQLIQPKDQKRHWEVYFKRMVFTGFNQSLMEAWPCARWLRPDLGPRSGMAVIEVGLPTGYVSWNHELRRYVREDMINTTLNHAEFTSKKVHFYFDYIGEEETCVYMKAMRWYPVANVSEEQELRVYDFFEPGLFNSTIYTTRNLFALDICLVCGSYECPYCPYYNTAPLAPLSPFLFLLSVAVALRLVLAPLCGVTKVGGGGGRLRTGSSSSDYT